MREKRTESEVTSLLPSEPFGARNSAPYGVHGSGGSTNEACTGVDGRNGQISSGHADTLSVHEDLCQTRSNYAAVA